MSNTIKLPPLSSRPIGMSVNDYIRARDLEIARVVLEAAAQSAALWHANGIESEIAREIRALEVRHHE